MDTICHLLDEVTCLSVSDSLNERERCAVMSLVSKILEMRDCLNAINLEKLDLLLYSIMFIHSSLKDNFSEWEQRNMAEVISILKIFLSSSRGEEVNNVESVEFSPGDQLCEEEEGSPAPCSSGTKEAKEKEPTEHSKSLQKLLEATSLINNVVEEEMEERDLDSDEEAKVVDDLSVDESTDSSDDVVDNVDYQQLFEKTKINNICCFPMLRLRCCRKGVATEIFKQSCLILKKNWKNVMPHDCLSVRLIEGITQTSFTFQSCKRGEELGYFSVAAKSPKRICAAVAAVDFVLQHKVLFNVHEIVRICKASIFNEHADGEAKANQLTDEEVKEVADEAALKSCAERLEVEEEAFSWNIPKWNKCHCFATMSIQNKFSGRILGPNGNISKIIQHYSKCRIRLYPGEQWQSARQIKIFSRSAESVQCAKDFINLLVNHPVRFGMLLESIMNESVSSQKTLDTLFFADLQGSDRRPFFSKRTLTAGCSKYTGDNCEIESMQPVCLKEFGERPISSTEEVIEYLKTIGATNVEGSEKNEEVEFFFSNKNGKQGNNLKVGRFYEMEEDGEEVAKCCECDCRVGVARLLEFRNC